MTKVSLGRWMVIESESNEGTRVLNSENISLNISEIDNGYNIENMLRDAAQDATREEQDAVQDRAQEEQDASQYTLQEAAQDAAQEAAQEALQDALQEALQEASQEASQEAAQEASQEGAQEASQAVEQYAVPETEVDESQYNAKMELVKEKESSGESSIKRKAVVTLTRGYNNLNGYQMLIERNLHISKNLRDKENTDVVVFHEGNITLKQQEFIKSKTPNLKMIFKNIIEYGFNISKKGIKHWEPTSRFPLSYRHMCSFWFVDFWHYVKDYEKIIRIDEDCKIYFNLDTMFHLLNNKASIFGTWVPDEDKVTFGLNQYTMEFLKRNNLPHRMRMRKITGPYTNVIGFNLYILRGNELLKKYVNDIKESNNIYIYRWGDLALWGEALSYMFPPSLYLRFPVIKYYHGSHNQQVENGVKVNNVNRMLRMV